MGNIIAVVGPLFSVLTSLPKIITEIEAIKSNPDTAALFKEIESEWETLKTAFAKL